MTDVLVPPVRIQVSKSTPISSKEVRSNLDTYLADYHARTVGKGGDAAMSVRLQKMSTALRAEAKGRKTQCLRSERSSHSPFLVSYHAAGMSYSHVF
ncbi:hypothetical protein BD410DRAFT_836389 [Rickenella mellea]|uniref:Uncharacterized protein n=1 Tax=Rickenella mellea TaxID=50990 RepID=A0A4Y7QFT7_9AGAM|nr:hypothetical protein BD410DRAFT_836389 [Rickenella mellea]